MSFNLGYPAVTHCLLVETEEGLVLVDSGMGTRDYTNPSSFMDWFMGLNKVPRDMEETAIRQVAALGYAPEDVRHIVLTHMHIDHTGGLPDFPWAKVHVYEEEYQAAMNRRRFSIKERFYSPAHWAHSPDWEMHSLDGEEWFGFDCTPVLRGKAHQVLLVPLAGHSRGHCGVAVKTPDGWLFHCGDAYIRQGQVDPRQPEDPFPGPTKLFGRWLFPPGAVQRLRELKRRHGDEARMFCSHDRDEFSRLRGEG